MTLELRVLSGSRAGQRERFDKPVVTIGRHPDSDLRFHAELDRDVSARHAEIRRAGAGYRVLDAGSTNGTFVNGARVDGVRELCGGDVVSFGEYGPRVEVRVLDDATERRGRDTSERVAAAVRQHTARLRYALTGLTVVLLAALAAAVWAGRREARARAALLDALVRRTDSLATLYGQDLARMSGQVFGLDSALTTARLETDRLRGELERARGDRAAGTVRALTSRLEAAESRRAAILDASRVDFSAIAERNGAAIALVAVEWAGGRRFSGTAFGVTGDGVLVTNRHLVQRDDGERPRRIAVIYSDTRAWLPALVDAVSADADLALLRVSAPGRHPTVAGIARTGTRVKRGEPVAIIGYPLGVDTPMEGDGLDITARSTLGAGTVGKVLSDVVQIDAYAGEGSSGSPVFDRAGDIVGVVYGGARESQGRIVYAVPVDRLIALLPAAASRLVR